MMGLHQPVTSTFFGVLESLQIPGLLIAQTSRSWAILPASPINGLHELQSEFLKVCYLGFYYRGY